MDEPQRENPEAVLEALLFVHGEPVPIATLAKHAGVSEVTVREKLVALEASYAREESGLALLARRDEVQLVTKPAMGVFIERMVKDERQEELTPASLETLAIIA
ncbi:MAG: SMC-Scp complex subunit ScpB, partial [Candidatus Colwellbacteria bacterium]|nr:SMC-Scp complex subunit ScpB [Candidatus Colwellbacteria bacterium]